MSDHIVETKSCTNCGIKYSITDKDLEYYERISPIFDQKKFQIPTPTHCPDCRQQRRLAWRNDMKLYRRKCDFSGKQMVSVYSQDSEYEVYDKDIWWSDKWDPMDYALDFDFNKSFFEQYDELLLKVPRMAITNKQTINSDYCSNSLFDKDSYLLYLSGFNKESYYGYWLLYCNNCIDQYTSIASELCYDCVNILNCYKCYYIMDCTDCSESKYLLQCKNVKSSMFCKGLNNTQYRVLNQQLTKEQYHQFLEDISSEKNKFLQKINQYSQLLSNLPSRYCTIESSENCIGDYLRNCKNVQYSFDCTNVSDSKFCYDNYNCMDSYDCSITGSEDEKSISQYVYEVENCVNAYDLKFCSTVWDSSYMIYCDTCFASTNCFACVGLRNKQYCIFNKQYSQDEYNKLLAKIIDKMIETGQWGEYFPIRISFFGYNETYANVFYPIDKTKANDKGYKWMDRVFEINVPEGIATIRADELPDISELQVASSKLQDILQKAIICEVSGRPFRILKQELDFYIKYGIQLPRRHYEIRQLDRYNRRNLRKLFDRNCDKCAINIKTTFIPETKQKIYCEKCYDESF